MSIGTTMDTTADPGVTIQIPDENPKPKVVDYEREVNLATLISAEEQKALCKVVIEDFDRDWASGEEFRKRRARQVELFAGIMPEKPPGHEKIAQIHLSIIAQSVLILHATIHGQLFPPTNHIYGARAVTPMANDRVRRVGLHMNWQVTTRIVEYLPANDRGMMQWLLYGTAFDCWYYDPIERRPCYQFIQTDDLVMPYSHPSVRNDLADVPRITRKLRKYRHEIEQLADVEYYANTSTLFDPGALDTAQDSTLGTMQKVEDKAQGQTPPTDDPSAPRLFLEQHRWYKLPGTNRERPVIATVDKGTNTLVRLVLREDEDPRDRARFNREKAANDARFEALTAQHQLASQEHEAIVTEMLTPKPATDELGMPIVDETGPVMLPPAPLEALPPAPMAPVPDPEPTPIRMVPVNWFTKYGCIPNPEGIYDFGVGYLLEGDNIAADTLMSQYVSAMTLSLFPTGFYSQRAKMQRGDIVLRVGEMNESPLPPGQLKDAFFQFQFPVPGPAVPKLIQQREEAGRQLVGASSILTGDTGEANETATAAQLRNNAARMNLAEMGNRYNKSRENSMRNLARINSKTLEAVEYFAVTMPGQMDLPPTAMEIARDDYLEDFQVTFTSDPRLASQPQRVQDALALLTQVLQIPPGALDPMAHKLAIQMAMIGYLKALDRDDMANLFENAPPPQPMVPPGAPGAGPPNPGETNGQQQAPGDVPGPDTGPPEGVVRPPGNAALPASA